MSWVVTRFATPRHRTCGRLERHAGLPCVTACGMVALEGAPRAWRSLRCGCVWGRISPALGRFWCRSLGFPRRSLRCSRCRQTCSWSSVGVDCPRLQEPPHVGDDLRELAGVERDVTPSVPAGKPRCFVQFDGKRYARERPSSRRAEGHPRKPPIPLCPATPTSLEREPRRTPRAAPRGRATLSLPRSAPANTSCTLSDQGTPSPPRSNRTRPGTSRHDRFASRRSSRDTVTPEVRRNRPNPHVEGSGHPVSGAPRERGGRSRRAAQLGKG